MTWDTALQNASPYTIIILLVWVLYQTIKKLDDMKDVLSKMLIAIEAQGKSLITLQDTVRCLDDGVEKVDRELFERNLRDEHRSQVS